jgi:hypothetical protein
VTSAEDADGWGSLSTNRTDKSVNDWRNFPSNTAESLTMKLLTRWEYNLGQLREFWKKIWT